MKYSDVFSEKEINVILKARDVFLISKQKYYIFKYINDPQKLHPLKFILCEALFRNIILELYSIFFDTTNNTIPKKIIPRLTQLLKQKDGIFVLEWDIDCHDLSTSSIKKERRQKIIKISIDNEQNNMGVLNLNITSIRDRLKLYRHHVLAHKSFNNLDYSI